MLAGLIVAIATAAFALAGGVLVGVRLGRRRRVAPVPPSRIAAGRPLPSLVLETLASGVVVVDRDERVVLSNPAGRNMGVLVGGRLGFAELVRLVRTCTDTGERASSAFDLPMGRLGREPVALAATAVPLRDPEDGRRVASIVLLLDDVTETRRLEAVRRDFVANVSHELKTPVGALTLLAEAVQDAADDPEAVQRFASRMQHEGTRLARLVRELIELSRLQGAEPLPGRDEVLVSHVLDEAYDQTRLAADRAGITVMVRTSDDLVVEGNEAQLVTAVANLLDNAVAYSAPATRVAVSARRTSEPVQLGDAAAATPSDASSTVDISVSDQGIGLAEHELSRVFERFYRVDQARSRATGGTGLGLAIVKHIATNHGGTVTVWSVEGAGSTFTMRLPLVHPRQASSAEQESTGVRSAADRSPVQSPPTTTDDEPGQPAELPSMAKGTA